MSAQAILVQDALAALNVVDATARAGGEVIQMADGRAGVRAGLKTSAANDNNAYENKGLFRVAKASGWVALPGIPIFWDRSANVALYKQDVGTGDFFLGTCVADAATGDLEVVVDLNARPERLIKWGQGIWDNVALRTSGVVVPNIALGLSGTDPGGTGTRFVLTANSEVQKTDAISRQSVPVTIPFIVRFRVGVFDIADSSTVDFTVGLANATHASDADTITESVFIHLDGASLDIYAESDDGTTEVAATDTTVNAVDDTYFDVWMDCRDLADIQIYINGVLVLPASVFTLTLATGPMKALIHIEKTSNDTTADIRVQDVEVWTQEVKVGPVA